MSKRETYARLAKYLQAPTATAAAGARPAAARAAGPVQRRPGGTQLISAGSRAAAILADQSLPQGCTLHAACDYNVRGANCGMISPGMRLAVLKSGVAAADVGSDSVTLTGRFPYGVVSSGRGVQPKMFQRGTFTRCLQRSPDIALVFGFDNSMVLGRTGNPANTLSIVEDNDGVYFENLPPDTYWSDGLQVSVSRGDISGLAAIVLVKRSSYNSAGVLVIETADLIRLSIVGFPEMDVPAVSIQQPAASAATFDRRDKAFLHQMGIQGNRI